MKPIIIVTKNTINTYILIVVAQKIAERSIPTGSPKDTAVFDLTQLGTLLGIGSEDAHDYILIHAAGAQADVLAGVPLAHTTKHGRENASLSRLHLTFDI